MTTLAAPRIFHPDALEPFRRDGFYVGRGLLEAAEVTALRDAFMEQGKNGPVEGLSEYKRQNGRIYDPSDPLAFYPRMMHPHHHPHLLVGQLAMRCMIHPRIYGYLCDFFGEEPAAVQSMFYFKPPGARGQDLHQDNFYLRVKPGTCIAAWMAVDDADSGNGGMVVVPGSNKLDIVCPTEADRTRFFTDHHVDIPAGMKEMPVSLKAGDVLFFNGSLIHGSYTNTSKDRFRRALICHYAPAASLELSPGYINPTLFNGRIHPIPPALGGGPCGNAQPARLH